MSLPINQASLRRRVLSAGAWSFAGYALSMTIRLGSNLLMTRLLAPKMFGIMAIAQIILFGMTLFSDVGLKPSVIRSKRGSEPAFLNTVWTIQIIRGLLLWSVGLLIGFFIYLAARFDLVSDSSVYGDHLLPFVVAAVSFTAVITGFESTKMIEAGRRLSISAVTKIDLCSQVAGLFAMAVWCLFDRSVWVLIGGGMVAALFRTVASHLWLPGTSNRWKLEWSAFHEIIRFGKWIFLSSILYFIASSGDRLLLGSLVDADALAAYVIAFLLFWSVDQALSKLIVEVSYPALSEIIRDRPGQLTTAYYRFHGFIASFTYFCSGALFISGAAIVSFLYDARYQQAGWILELLALALLTWPLRIATQCFLALGVEHIYFVLHVIRIVALFIALLVGFHFAGFYGAVWGIVLSYFANTPLTFFYASRYRMFEPRKEIIALLTFGPGLAFGVLLNYGLSLLKHAGH
jgi:O-antigen/teichoic acid export membrane protein